MEDGSFNAEVDSCKWKTTKNKRVTTEQMACLAEHLGW